MRNTRSKQHLENIKQDDVNIAEWIVQEPIVNIFRKIYTIKPLKQIATENIKKDDKKLKTN